MGQRRFTRLTNGFSKKLDNHVAAVALYVAHYNLCRILRWRCTQSNREPLTVSRWERDEDNIDSNAEALIRVCATQELGLPTDTKVAEISGWCVQGAEPEPLVIDGHDPSNYRLKKAA
jgi:hypothetical protein